MVPGTYSGHPTPPGASGKHAGGLGTAAGTAACARVGGHHLIRVGGEAGRQRRRGRRRGGWCVGGRPYEVVAERARLIVLPDLVRTVEHRARAVHDPRLSAFEARRRHASGVRLLRAIGKAEPVLGDAIEAEGRVNARARHQISLIYVGAHRRRVERRAQTAVGAALRDGLFIHRVIEDCVDIDEVHAVGNVEAIAVGVVAVAGWRARKIFGAGAWSRVIAERERSAAAWHEVARRERDVGVGGAEAGRPVGGIAPERVRIGDEVHDAGRRRRRRR